MTIIIKTKNYVEVVVVKAEEKSFVFEFDNVFFCRKYLKKLMNSLRQLANTRISF